MFVLFVIALVLVNSMQLLASTESSTESEEVPYDQLIRELNSRVNRHERQRLQTSSIDPFEKLKIHLSLGFIQTVNAFSVADRSMSRTEDGLQLGVGIDLFSEEWVAEGILKNFGQSTQNETTLAMREFDLRLSYLQPAPEQKLKLRLANGLGARYLRYSSPWSGGPQYQTTPVYLLGLGLLVPVGNHFDLDFEVQGHLTLVNDTIDRHGLSLVFRLDNVF